MTMRVSGVGPLLGEGAKVQQAEKALLAERHRKEREMMTRSFRGRTLKLAGLAVVVASACATGAVALAGGGGSGVTRLGPFPLPDFQQTGSCGNVWDVTNYSLLYTVYPVNRDGTYTVVQTAIGFGKSVAGSSPNACNGGPNNGVTVGAGIPVVEPNDITVQRVSGGTFNPAGTCASPCVFANNNFSTAFFGASATHQLLQLNYVFRTACNGQLIFMSTQTPNFISSGDISGPKSGCSS